ncbi:hypothetical protein [Xanthocytophaga agilis]|uniref:Uncharacterized protein n=1 Tax=Xanthocytophaga agilis TaxID=3048010 RepID=A0AAE3R7F9_9BACT|nr:hypothetical protein [Xanthocytophaga agilis]MDJ1505226.1 hypothetical protein [Xanthocytophaga agilis]
MITRRYLEKESTVLGLPMLQVGMLIMLTVVLIIFSTFLKLMAPGFKWFNHATVIIVTSAYFGLKYASRQKHPSFITSYLSYRFQQKSKRFSPTADSVLNAESILLAFHRNQALLKKDTSNWTQGNSLQRKTIRKEADNPAKNETKWTDAARDYSDREVSLNEYGQ